MKHLYTSLLALSVLASTSAFGQAFRAEKCAADQLHTHIKQRGNGLHAADVEALDRKIVEGYAQQLKLDAARPAQAKGNTPPTFVIPIVFHFAGVTVDQAAVNRAVSGLNNYYRKRNADSVNINPAFASLYADMNIEFRLAQLDPNGNCTPGYTYTPYAQTANSESSSLKTTVTNWDRSKYLNIWIVQGINGSGVGTTLGYALLPSGAAGNPSEDGIVLVKSSLGTTDRTLEHEAGHYFGLQHTWGTGEVARPGNCSGTDNVADTPPTNGSFSNCPSNYSPCGTQANVQNIMDYSSCPLNFTPGQRTLVHSVLNNQSGSFGFRRNLWQPANLAATGTNGQIVSCTPVLQYNQGLRDACVNQPQTFVATVNANQTDPSLVYTWTFEGPTTVVANGSNPSITFTQPGLYNMKVKVQNFGGADSIIINNGLRIRQNPPVVLAPNAWPFDVSPFSSVPAESGIAWDSRSTFTTSFTHATLGSGANANGVVQLLLASQPVGTINTLTSPNLDMSAFAANPSSSVALTFSRAAVRRNSSNTDTMRVQISTNCGTTWTTLRFYLPATLYTTSSNLSGTWIPASSEWVQQSISINSYRTASNVMVRFLVISGGGNRLFLDDININDGVTSVSVPIQTVNEFSAYPNPSGGNATLQMNLSRASDTRLELTDVLGRTLSVRDLGLMPAGEHQIELAKLQPGLSPGVYQIRLTTGTEFRMIRLVVN